MREHDRNTVLRRPKALISAENVLYIQKMEGTPQFKDAPPREPIFWGLSEDIVS
jgi:hypothetical protein